MLVPASSPRALLLAAFAVSPLLGCLDWSKHERPGAQEDTETDASAPDADIASPQDDADTAPPGDDDADAQVIEGDAAGEPNPDAALVDPDAGEPDASSDVCPATACRAPYKCSGNATTYTCQGQYADFPLPIRRSGDDFATQQLRVERLVVHDDVTGLMWPREALTLGLAWPDAVAACDESTLGGFDDWRLAGAHELVTLLGSERSLDISTTAFIGFAGNDYWTTTLDSEVLDDARALRTYQPAWLFALTFNERIRTHCVRTERVTYSGAPGDRFVSDANGALVHDTRTHLYWETRVSPTRTALAYQDAADYCGGLVVDSHHFRLPSMAELISVIDYAQPSGMRLPSLFSNPSSQGFWSRSLGSVDADPPETVTVHSFGTTESATLADGRYGVRCVSPG